MSECAAASIGQTTVAKGEGVGGVRILAGRLGRWAVLLVMVAASACALAPACAAAPVPGDLAALEQQMAQLQANSERFTFQEELAFGGFLGQSVPFVLIVAGDGEASDSPAQVSLTASLLGTPAEQVRVIGDSVYRYRSQAAEIDGGRPWVRGGKEATKQLQGLDPGGILEGDQAGARGTFSKLIEELNGALSIEESGPATVDGQRVLEFDAALDPAPFLAQLKAQSKEPKHPFSLPLETSPVGPPKAPAKPAPAPSLELEVFIAPNGLPVRVRVTFSAEGSTVAERVDTLAINVPVAVKAPPAGQTIDEAQLKRLERLHAARELAQALRACRDLHGRSSARCKALAHLKSRVPRSEESLL